MYDTFDEIAASSAKGYVCAQTVMKSGLALQKAVDPSLVRALNALGGGCYTRKSTCGALIGACCVAGWYAGRAYDDETQHELMIPMTRELVAWFEATYGAKYGDITCAAIRVPEDQGREERQCNGIIFACCQKAAELVQKYGFIEKK